MVFNDGPPIVIASNTINESSILPPRYQRYFLPLTRDPIGQFIVNHISLKIANVDRVGCGVLSTSVFSGRKEGWNSTLLSVCLRNWFQLFRNRSLLNVWMKTLTIFTGQLHLLHYFKSGFSYFRSLKFIH